MSMSQSLKKTYRTVRTCSGRYVTRKILQLIIYRPVAILYKLSEIVLIELILKILGTVA